MDNQELDAVIRADFETWSGGFPPESTSQIYTYCDAARPCGTFEEVYAILQKWMDEENDKV